MLLSQRYKYVEFVGKGGASTVSLALQKKNNKRCVIKSFINYNHENQISTEIATLVRLQNVRNIVRLYDIIEDQEKTYLVLNEIPFGTMKDSMKYRLSEKDMRKIASHCLQVLKECHDNGVVHNDVKPENFMFLKKDDVSSLQLIDFDNAILDGQYKLPLLLRGTPHYMSKESLQYESNTKSDVWSFGVLMYHMMTFSYPFEDFDDIHQPDMYKIWAATINEEPGYPKYFSPDLLDLLQSVFQKDHSNRLSIEEVLKHKWFRA